MPRVGEDEILAQAATDAHALFAPDKPLGRPVDIPKNVACMREAGRSE